MRYLEGVVRIDQDFATRALQIAVKFRFAFDHAVNSSEAFQMRSAKIGNIAQVGFGNVAQGVNFALVVGAHFNDGQFMGGLQLQERKRNTQMVVEVALCGVKVEFLAEYSGKSSFTVVFPLLPVKPIMGFPQWRLW